MINRYLKTSKSAMYFSPWSYEAIGFRLLAAVREAIEANYLLQINFGCQYQLLEDRKYKAQRNH